ncbi:MAG TPA: Gfo/Idh/MocA family oxidoreductase [Vicinamibacterales bacterium]|jgi:predicted dehydrogenase
MTYRSAIIGTGRVGSLLERDPRRPKPHSHAGWHRRHPSIELVAGADIDPERLSAFGEDWGIPADRLFADYREMLAVVRPDIVSIAAWAPARLEMVLAALDAGARGLWIEKAIATSIDEAERLREVIARTGATAIVDHPRRADGAYRAVKRVIDEGTLGELQTVNCLMSGHLMHTGTHAWDVLLYWCGPWRSATGWLDDPAVDGVQVKDTGGHAHVVFGGDVHAYVTGRDKRYYIFQFDLVFSEGRIQIGNDVRRVMRPADSPRYTGFRELVEVTDLPLDDPYPHPMVYDLVHAMESRVEPVMSVRNAIDAFGLGLALFQSGLDNHKVVTPDLLDRTLRVESV